MEIELALNPDDAGKPALLNALLKDRTERTRSQAMHIVWHDSPERALAAQGLTLAEQRGTWRLERLSPGGRVWAPGAPPPVLQEAARRDALSHSLPDGLTPVAAFGGRQSLSSAMTADGPVIIRLTRGSIRTVTAQHVAARLCIEGSEPAVRGTALMLAAGMRLSVPCATLAADALALAEGDRPKPRRLGLPELPDEIVADRTGEASIATAFRHILGHLVDVIVHHAAEITPHRDSTEPVHQMRVAVRRARSAIAVFRHALPAPPLDEADHTLRTLARHLGPTRDWDVFIGETMPDVIAAFSDDARLSRLAAAAERRCRQHRDILRAYLATPEFRIAAIGLAWLAASHAWHDSPAGTLRTQPESAPNEQALSDPSAESPAPPPAMAPIAGPPALEQIAGERTVRRRESALQNKGLEQIAGERTVRRRESALQNKELEHFQADSQPENALADFAAAALERRCKKLRTAGKRIRKLDLASLHRLRLRTKRTRYAAEMLAGLYAGRGSGRFIHRLGVLQERLGVLNDGKVAADLLAELGGAGSRHSYAIGLVLGFTAAKATRIRPKVTNAWEKFRAVAPFWT